MPVILSNHATLAMDNGAILAGITAAARKELHYQGELRPEMRLVEDLQLDSIRLLSLAMAVEDHFRVALDADDEGGIRSVSDLIVLVAKKLGEKLEGAAGLAKQGGG